MNNHFAPPPIPSSDANPPPACPRRLLNEHVFLKRADDLPQAPITSARKMRLRFAQEQTILVNDAGLVRAPTIKGTVQ
jgi:hypothetical protein